MSESMAFIGGVAVAGLAALVLLKGAGNSLQPNFAVTPQMPAVVQPQMMPPQYPYGQPLYPNNQPPTAPNSERLADIESVKSELARLKSDNEQLRTQNQQLQWQFQSYNQQQQQLFAQQNNQKTPLQPQTPWWSSPIVWAVGGMTLTIGGGVVVAGVLALFSPKQRPSRTVQVIHPYQGPTQPLVPVRRTEFLPPRMEARRVEAPEYDEMH
ncbi:heterocyst differentiation related protein [Nostoc sp. T09]|uniref:heterocyst differentiation related protein n=1 Tax=Nostoc sp. T09 TaxID=1932621 RepID=UPI000A37CADB|nr:heterocyst differentiation related protein [Nostoc sp. T09]OUL26415.1 heterocyst differentiation related protein [Nostoc sp. T09]